MPSPRGVAAVPHSARLQAHGFAGVELPYALAFVDR
jgi:hypothetical protein